MAATGTIEFEGKKIKYDPSALKKWSVQRRLASGGADSYDACDEILFGKSDEIAAEFEDDAQKMNDLLMAIIEKENSAKN